MVVTAADLSTGLYSVSGNGASWHLQPPAIHLQLSEDELLKLTPTLYRASGGSVSSFHGVTHTGTNTHIAGPELTKLASVIEDICSAFGLTKDEMAKACRVQTRKTLYNWINGEAKPRKSTMSRLYDLQMVAKAWSTSGFGVDRSRLFEPVVAEKSIFALLSEPKIDKDLLLFAGSRMTLTSAAKGSLDDPFA